MTALFQPLSIFLFGMGGGFMLPLLYKLGKPWLHAGFWTALGGLTLSSLVSFVTVWQGGVPLEVFMAGAEPPVSINLRFGLAEGAFAVSVNIVALLLATALWAELRGNYVALLLFLILVMGINGMILTRDIFNLFVFLEIVSIGTYGLLGLSTSRAGVQAAMKYVMATVIASTLFLVGTALLYYVTGNLNIDLLIAGKAVIVGPIGAIALAMILTALVVELKPYPANGWGLDVYETAPPALAALLSVGASTGMFFALIKLLPLFEAHLEFIIATAAVTFLASNLIGLRQDNIQRLLGYSSIGQMALMVLALCVLTRMGAQDAIPLVVFGLFVNHLLAKAGLFVLAGAVGANGVATGLGLTRRPALAVLLALFIIALSALPPFPGFWAKWELILRLAGADRFGLIVLLLVGSLLEAAYLFRWFLRTLSPAEGPEPAAVAAHIMTPLLALAGLLVVTGAGCAVASGAALAQVALPLVVGGALALLAGLPRSVAGVVTLAVIALTGWALPAAPGIPGLFAPLLLVGGVVIAVGGLARADVPALHFPLVAVLLLAIQTLLRAQTGLEFYVAWEFITLSSFFLIAQRRAALPEVLRFLLFSLAAAFLLLAGFALISAQTGARELEAIAAAGPDAAIGIALLGAGFLVKAAALGVHVWLPGAYSEAPDDVTALLSAVVSKTAIFGLLVGAYAALQSGVTFDFTHVLAWIGMATTVGAAILALMQTDVKRLLAFSSMSQLGYIVTAIALMSHLGWVAALYVVANHMLVKGILFLAMAGVILRLNTRRLDQLGGLAREMPLTLFTVAIALLAMSGLPPLMGFGGKWLLLSALADKGWTGLAVAGAVATFLGLWYMLRLFAAVFLGPPAPGRAAAGEAPVVLLVPQLVLVGAIAVLSFFPRLLMDPVSAAIDPQFAATLVWEGQSLETIYGLWNPTPVMIASVTAAAVLAVIWWGIGLMRPGQGGLRLLIVAGRPLPQRIMPPVAVLGWDAVGRAADRLADLARRVYSGDGQIYVLFVLAYFLVLYFWVGRGSLL
jgi:formate hydrogenlyase subunit 3/multisubunit Na+/H+ antiporter MnhD subunit